MVVDNPEAITAEWAISKKINVYIGIDGGSGEIEWYKQGMFVINSFSVSESTSSYTVSISAQDKMCLLNGTSGGTLFAEVDFGNITTYVDGTEVEKELSIFDIIKEALHSFGGERYDNIVIKDIEDALEILEYQGNKALYRKSNTLSTNPQGGYIEEYGYGDIVGYRPTALTYSEKEFILKPGDSVGTLLEKIKNKFGLYEYFYDVDGKFIFQKKRTYINFQCQGLTGSGEVDAEEEEYIANYENKEEIISISTSPQLSNIKNDYSIWGSTSEKIPFHIRVGINKKPTQYVSYNGTTYTGDYRELIYQMARDYYRYHQNLDFYAMIEYRNPWAKDGITSYEGFYADMKEFWPQIYDAEQKKIKQQYQDDPSQLVFWFELVNGSEKFWIKNIGTRLKSENNSDITAVVYKDIPKFLFQLQGGDNDTVYQEWYAANKNISKFGSGYTVINVPADMASDFAVTSKHYSALELVEQYIYSYTNFAETTSITIIPNYQLKTNYKILVLGIPYSIKKISVPLTYNGTMKLELTRIYEQ